MKSVLISINPKWCEMIACGHKTLDIRKTRPKLKTPFKVYIYQTKFPWLYDTYSKIENWQQKVIGEFVCDCVSEFNIGDDLSLTLCEISFLHSSLLKHNEIVNYIGAGNKGYGWHISDLKIYNTPKDLYEFYTMCSEWGKEKLRITGLARPPQSWCYIEEDEQ